jgi:uncharacterized protein (TIGR03085 family)
MSHAQTERAFTCDALLTVGPSAPTLCEGWTAHDLAAHLWLRENEQLSALGFFVPALQQRTDDRMTQLKGQLSYDELVDLIRQGPPRFSVFGLPGADEAANSVEYLIHGMDLRRPNDLPEPERDAEFLDWCWSRTSKVAPLMLRKSPVALVLEWDGRRDHSVRVGKGDRIVTVIGRPDELLLYAFGRAAAEVRFVGLDEAVDELRAANQ